MSTSPTFATYTRYPVILNNSLADNVSTANVSNVHINISSAAAGQSTVYIRFVYYDEAGQTGGYAWMIDDVSITELNAHDVSIEKSFMWEPMATAYNSSIFNTPLNFVDSIYPVTQLSNLGNNTETSLVTTAKIYQGSTSVYTSTDTYPSLVLNAYDSVIQFAGYKPNAIGSYTCTYSTALANDSDMTNNVDTARFNVTDTTWMVNQGLIGSSYYIHRGGANPISYFMGARFDVPASATPDTISGFGVSFSSSSVATGAGLVSVQLYKIQDGDNGWSYAGASSVSRSLTSADYSTTTTGVWAYFRIDPVSSGGYSSFVLEPGYTYAAMVQSKNVTGDLLVRSTNASNATGFSGYFGQSDSSMNNGATDFSPGSIATGLTSVVPMVRLYFGNIVDKTAVNELQNADFVGSAYPNPANTSINIPFTLANSATVKVTLTNSIGQVVKSTSVVAVGGQSSKATIATGDLASGLYIYTVEANGQHTNGRIAITH